jgi:hypothetical protein
MRPSHLIPSLLAVAACAPVDPDIELTAFQSCDQMSTYMTEMARQEVLYDWKWEPGGFLGSYEYAMTAEDGGTNGEGASSYSTTNVQEEGVDESDLVKTDGTWLYSLSGTTMVVSRAWPVADAAMVATVAIDGQPSGLYLYGDLLVVESTVWNTPEPRSGVAPTRSTQSGRTLVTLVDVSEPEAPTVLRETYAAGALVESRRVGQHLYVVTYQDLSVTVQASNAREAEKAVEASVARDWLPWLADNKARTTGDWETSEDVACDCVDVYASDREGGSYLVSVLGLDLDDPDASFEGSAVVGAADTVYASSGALYVAASEYEEGPFPSIDSTLQTVVHKFDLDGESGKPQYAASAKVLGVLEDRFGLSEYDNVLRLATTEWQDESSAVVTTLREEDGDFSQLDQLDGIGAGEEIFATRFTGDVGYVVTYEQIDPLFALDLGDPTDIQLGGHLEMDGWSDYLHPMDDDHLLSVGIDGDWKLAVSLFDVSDIMAPTLIQRLSLEAGSSESQYEPHAFNYFAEQDALAIPAWSDDYEPVLEVLTATTSGLSYGGRISQEAVLEATGVDSYCAPVRRSVIFEDQAFAVGGAGLTVAALSDPDTVVQSVPFVGVDPCDVEYDYGDEEW